MKKLLIIMFLVIGIDCLASASEISSPPKRIVSLAPSMTEILYALGLGDNIVGVTTFCDYPEEAKKKPKIGGMSNPSLEAVISLKPDMVVLTTDGNPKEFEDRLVTLKINTFVFQARRLLELPQGIRDLGRALGVKDRADKLAHGIGAGIDRLRTESPAFHVSRRSPVKKKILFIVWPEPLIVAGPGTVIDDAISLLGYENTAGSAQNAYPKYSIEEVIHQSPDVIVIGKGHVNMKEVSQGILKRMASVPAVKNGEVFYVSDSLYRLGPRVIKGIEELSECLK